MTSIGPVEGRVPDEEQSATKSTTSLTSMQEEELDDKPKSILKAMISQLSYGMDLSKVTLPTFILEPRSLLERSADFMTHPDLWIAVNTEDDPMQRMLAMTRWYVSGFHRRPKGVKKPFNPILGEHFHCHYQLADGSKTHFHAEQTSHHPPISCVYYENREHNMVLNGCIRPRSKFLGNSAASLMDGESTVYLLDRGETYTMGYPDTYARGIILGKMLMETVGEVTIACPQTKLKVVIEFKAKGYIRGTYNELSGKVFGADGKTAFTLSGRWDNVIEIGDAKGKNKKEFLNVRPLVCAPKWVTPLADQEQWESRRLWNKVATALRERDVDAATAGKSELEENQRQDKRDREAAGQEWETKLFTLKDKENLSSWEYKQINLTPNTAAEGTPGEAESRPAAAATSADANVAQPVA